MTWMLPIAVAIGLTAATSLWAQQLNAAREEAIKVTVNAAMDQYNAWFVAGRADLIAEHTYLTPSVRMDETGLSVLSSKDDIRRLFESSLQSLAADGYATSEWPVRNVCVLSESSAIVSGRYMRYRKDGSVIGEYGGTYTFAKASDGWRIASFTRHDPATVIRCSR